MVSSTQVVWAGQMFDKIRVKRRPPDDWEFHQESVDNDPSYRVMREILEGARGIPPDLLALWDAEEEAIRDGIQLLVY
jgi:hypothetical protein